MADIKLDTTTYEFDKLAEKYSNFYSPTVEIAIEDTNIVREGVAVTTVSVTTSVASSANHCRFTVANAYDWVSRDFTWLDEYLSLGKKVSVKMGYVDKLEVVFVGLITSLDFDYPEDGTPSITVTCMDYSYSMMGGKAPSANNNWTGKSHSEIVKTIVGNYSKLTIKKVDDTTSTKDLQRDAKHDFNVIQELASLNNFEFFVLGQNFYFRKPDYTGSPVITLVYGKNLRSFSTKSDISSQVKEVIVHGLDDKYQSIEAKSESVKPMGSNSKTGADIVKAIGSGKVHYEYTNLTDKEALQQRANALAAEKAMDLVTGSGTSLGLPELIAGRVIKLDGLGAGNNGPMYLTSVTHTINSSGYTTRFEVRRNAV